MRAGHMTVLVEAFQRHQASVFRASVFWGSSYVASCDRPPSEHAFDRQDGPIANPANGELIWNDFERPEAVMDDPGPF